MSGDVRGILGCGVWGLAFGEAPGFRFRAWSLDSEIRSLDMGPVARLTISHGSIECGVRGFRA